MPRSIWNGALSFGLVNVPVQLFSATHQKDVRFHQFHEHCHGAFVLHDDGSVECTAGPASRLDAHWLVISADDRRDVGVLPPEPGGTPPVTG